MLGVIEQHAVVRGAIRATDGEPDQRQRQESLLNVERMGRPAPGIRQ